ncbi:hypothetical protein LOTGIDRAFT_117918 [Lottia gigantea]|uniref:Mitochondrial pyruvate carrier n=1 Tax=Lottia gigantea TaxID=225164 RepID=V4C055_LOTGI|nr:hypothetical protein LOTGIDRAFT_117918 [Lottia gigantea]ESO94804.1 hypothetical protein LOTGIDRAFT_117918 [Lottia gigantea]
MAGPLIKKGLNYVSSKDFRDYLCRYHFWGPVANWGLPLAALGDLKKDPEIISGKMTLGNCLLQILIVKYS